MALTQKELAIILQEGEGYRIEFKERIANLGREFVAFANASGGRIFLGITDDGKISGISIDNKVKSQIQDVPVYVKAVFPRPAKLTGTTTQDIILKLLKNNPSITRNDLADKTGLSPDGGKYHLQVLKRQGIIKHTGSTKKGKWALIK